MLSDGSRTRTVAVSAHSCTWKARFDALVEFTQSSETNLAVPRQKLSSGLWRQWGRLLSFWDGRARGRYVATDSNAIYVVLLVISAYALSNSEDKMFDFRHS